ncbi:sporulation protein YtfJ [Geomicrobium halophilum]|uniref:Sporulation protein YtfJ n=1 Tax=Geomicrobium halophilum TaxID=549000 RepID=A0A841PKF9_9BACL|nr:GerW family sporulation protein [Geomicrobium halophilum]MBB6448154.1 sporulation protein YtfJ [Geomicrobium halophilum]
MSEHPIQGLMKTAMENIKEMVDVNTIIGDPVETPDGSVIIPVSKVGFGFAAGGSQIVTDKLSSYEEEDAYPFGGGSGGGVSITPIAFLVVGTQGIKMIHLDNQTHFYEKLLEFAPQVVEKIKQLVQGDHDTQGPSDHHYPHID